MITPRRGRSRASRPWLPPLAKAGVALALVIAWGIGLWRFAAALPREPVDVSRQADVIVVLTGGARRVAEGFDLLAARAAPRLFISGVPRGISAIDLGGRRLPPPLLACCVTLGHAAEDTIGNAAEIAGYMAAGGFRSLRLVTADYHMPRAVREVARVLPQVTILAHPVFPEGFKRAEWWRWPGTTGLVMVEYTKSLVAGARHAIADLVVGGSPS